MVFCSRAVFLCPSIWSLICPWINSLPSVNAAHSSGLAETICAFALVDAIRVANRIRPKTISHLPVRLNDSLFLNIVCKLMDIHS